MFKELAYYLILGKPLIAYLGITTISCFFFTAAIAILNRRGINWIPFKWHPRMAAVAIALAIIHGLLGILAYF